MCDGSSLILSPVHRFLSSSGRVRLLNFKSMKIYRYESFILTIPKEVVPPESTIRGKLLRTSTSRLKQGKKKNVTRKEAT